MKNAIKAVVLAAGIFSFSSIHAQTHKDTTLGQKMGRDAKMVGHKTAHVAASGAAVVTDKKYSGKMGPGGQAIYINKNSHYFYVNKTGHRVYLKKSQLRDKPMK